MDQTEIERIVGDALKAFMRRMHRYSVSTSRTNDLRAARRYPSAALDRHTVHTEYNRHGIEPKDIELPDAQRVLTSNRVNPDIIIHQPGHDEENILVIEVKKTTNAVADDADLAKLREIKRQIGYRFAVFLRLPAGPTVGDCDIRIVWV